MDSLPEEILTSIYDFLADKDVILYHCTCNKYIHRLPHHVSCLRVLQQPFQYRKVLQCFLTAMETMQQQESRFTLHVYLNDITRISNRVHAEEWLTTTRECIDRILNRFLSTNIFLTRGEVSSHVMYGRGGIFPKEPRFYNKKLAKTTDFIRKFREQVGTPSNKVYVPCSVSRSQQRWSGGLRHNSIN